MPEPDDLLGGLCVLVTRPHGQAEGLCERIARHGGIARHFPLLEIIPPNDQKHARQQLAILAQCQWIIFISANAVFQGWPYIVQSGGLPNTTRVAAVGKATAQALATHGVRTDLIPEHDYSSEGLLAMPPLHTVRDQHILIVRGEGGKETLAAELRERGAFVHYAEVYRRHAPDAMLEATCQNGKTIDVITISSAESLHNLVQLAQQQQAHWVFTTRLLVVHPRQVMLAKNLGFKLDSQLAENATDDAVFTALCTWQRHA